MFMLFLCLVDSAMKEKYIARGTVSVLDFQSRGPGFKTTGRPQSQLSFSSFLGRSNKYQKFLKL